MDFLAGTAEDRQRHSRHNRHLPNRKAEWSMRSGWIAFLVSMVLHGTLLGALCVLPGRKVEKPAGNVFVQDGTEASEDIAITLVSTDTMEIPAPKKPQVELSVPPPPQTKPVSESPGPVDDGQQPAQSKQVASGIDHGVPLGNGGTGPRVAPSFFHVPATGSKIVYLIDASASMGKHGALDAAREELLRSVCSLPQTMQFQIVVFHLRAFPLLPQNPDWITPTPDAVADVENALRALPAEGGTDPRTALRYALSRQPDVLFFLTDAGEIKMETIREITHFNRGRSIVHVIELGAEEAGSGDLPLQLLAEHNGGVFQAVSLTQGR
jgi:hypothetical protein